jgi:hypothetical protein
LVKATEISDKLNAASEHKKSATKSKQFEYEATDENFTKNYFLKMVNTTIISKCIYSRKKKCIKRAQRAVAIERTKMSHPK